MGLESPGAAVPHGHVSACLGLLEAPAPQTPWSFFAKVVSVGRMVATRMAMTWQQVLVLVLRP